MKVVNTAQMRLIEQRSVAMGVTINNLMESAGLAIARSVTRLLDGVRGKRIIVLVGPGNNGGDGMIAARYLSEWGGLITLYMTMAKRKHDQFEECRKHRIRIMEAADDLDEWALSSYLPLTDLVLDAVLGLGQNRPLDGTLRSIFNKLCEAKLSQPHLKIASVDIPTGVNADTGAVDQGCPQNNLTITLGAPKIGFYRFPAADYVGQVETADIGLPEGVDNDFLLDLANNEKITALLPVRPLDSHKGNFGRVAVVAGSRQFIGAAMLASSAAYRSGAGLVTLATPKSVNSLVAAHMLETTHSPLPETSDGLVAHSAASAAREILNNSAAGVIGPGLGESDGVLAFVQDLLLADPPLRIPAVIDADALNALARIPFWWQQLNSQVVLTPHPGEMSRLLQRPIEQIQHDRVNSALRASQIWGQVTVLKGAYTIVASPNGEATISPFANPALASAGTGDVLAGVIGALLGQGLNPHDAATVGVHLHAQAGEKMRKNLGNAGTIASDLLPIIPKVMKELHENF